MREPPKKRSNSRQTIFDGHEAVPGYALQPVCRFLREASLALAKSNMEALASLSFCAPR